jgi:hypothetical protein
MIGTIGGSGITGMIIGATGTTFNKKQETRLVKSKKHFYINKLI